MTPDGAARVTSRIASITVAFNPSAQRFTEQLLVLVDEVAQVIVIDNGSKPAARTLVPEALAARILWHEEPHNLGIAGALNRGIDLAGTHGCTLVLTMDHDSVPKPGMVAQLLATYHRLETSDTRIAAVGPRIVDARNSRPFPFVRLGWLHNRKIYCSEGQGAIWCDFLITSGTLARTDVFAAGEVGLYDESLFIDSVDMEWCYRARSRGYSLYGACAAALDHRLGDGRVNLLPGFSLIVHSPLRLYYMTRNRIALYRRGYVPLKWKLKDIFRMCAKLVSTLMFLTPRKSYLAMSALAFRDGWRGASGRYQPRD